MTAVVQRIILYPLTVPLRRHVSVESEPLAALSPLVVAVELSRGIVGYGESPLAPAIGLEGIDPAFSSVRTDFSRPLLEFRADSFPDALERIEVLPKYDHDAQPLTSIRAAIEVALVDASMRYFQRGIDDLVQWMGLPGFGTPGSLKHIRYASVLSGGELSSGRLRWMAWTGVRQVKFHYCGAEQHSRLNRLVSALRRPLRSGGMRLIVDARGRWSKDEAIEWLTDHRHVPISGLEQPLAKGAEAALPVLKDLFDMPLIHDESLVTEDDARRLEELGVADGFNIGISKCGGLLPTLRLAAMARRVGADLHLGCEPAGVGILSSAAVRLLQVCPSVVCAESQSIPTRLLPSVTKKTPSRRAGQRPPQLPGPGIGCDVRVEQLQRYCPTAPVMINF